jgi:RNA polymerase sigma-70 factor (ECF subfamily)
MTQPVGAEISAESADARWAELYEAHFDTVYRLVRRLGVPDGEAEDVTQRVYLRARELLGRKDEEIHNETAWLRAVAVRVVSEHHRFWRLRKLKQWFVETAWPVGAAATPEDETRSGETQRQVADVLARMSPKLRSVLVLVEIEELTPSEAAEVLGLSLNTVKSRRRLAREDFARRWERRHGSEP